MTSFPSTETIFHAPKCKKYAFAGFSKFDAVPACVKIEVGRRFDVNRPFYSCVLSYLAINASEAGGDLALIQTSQLFSFKCT